MTRKAKKKKKTFVFTLYSVVQALGAVDHWSDIVTSQRQSSRAIVHVVPMQRFTVCMSGDGSSVMSCFCVPLYTAAHIVLCLHSACEQWALGPSWPAEPWNFSVLEVF